ncbi:MAG: ATP-grasp domain-containing protein [Acidobacteriota bacterium]
MTSKGRLTWVLEPDVLVASHEALAAAARAAGHEVLTWSDDWARDDCWPRRDGPVLFHGSLGLADRIARESPWSPGAYCASADFHCTATWPRLERWLLNERWRCLPACELVADPRATLEPLGITGRVFVRPDSPLKPFAGRVVETEGLTLASLDHGFYFDDERLPVVVAPVVDVTHEHRFVVVAREVVAGGRYDGPTRATEALPPDPTHERLAREVASELVAPEPVYVLDTGESAGEPRVVELNPFSGADLHGCDARAIVKAVGESFAS